MPSKLQEHMEKATCIENFRDVNKIKPFYAFFVLMTQGNLMIHSPCLCVYPLLWKLASVVVSAGWESLC